MTPRFQFLVLCLFGSCFAFAQLPLVRDTITVIENTKVLKMPWANGLNFANVSALDVNNDGVNDLVIYDKSNQYSTGRFRCFVNTGGSGSAQYIALPELSYFFPAVKSWAVFYDYNGDGKNDLFCSTDLGIKVFKNISGSNGLSFVPAKLLLYSNYNPGGQAMYLNLYASSAAVPGFADIDNDGDLDILSFAPQGIFVEYHKNMSRELYGHADSLVFERSSACWGNVSENNCAVDFGLCSGSKPLSFITSTVINGQTSTSKPYHAGSCLTCFDNDGDGDKDLIMGDIGCNLVQFVKNNGTPANASFNDTTKLYPNYPNKNSTKAIRMNNYPCTYFVDADKDNKPDLFVSPNTSNSENYKSLWFYKNIGNSTQVNFQFVKENFLQDEMIDVGQNSYPALIDYNADGKKDLLIGTYGYYSNNTLKAQLTLYENTGTATVPRFTLVTRDYGNLSNQGLNNVMPCVGDVDGDGDTDILIGTGNGQIHWLKNSGGANNPCNFTTFLTNPFGFTTSSGAASPQLFDLDADGLPDLLIGTMSGKIAFYKNVGAAANPSFSLITNALGNVDVTVDPLLQGFSLASPYAYKENGNTFLLVGSLSGQVFYYSVPTNLNNAFTLLNTAVNHLLEGPNASICYEDINGDGKRDLFVGGAGGGLSFFTSDSKEVGLSDLNKTLPLLPCVIFPNPFSHAFTVKSEQGVTLHGDYRLRDLLGNVIKEENLQGSELQIDLSDFPGGIYVLEVTQRNAFTQTTQILKLIKSGE
jgi:hypothetical protein